MAGIPKVKIQFDADFDELKKGVKGATHEVEGFGDKVGDFAKKAGAAFALAGAAAAAYAGKLLIDGVKSAIEDEAAQAKLAATLENVTGATNAQIKATEGYILKTQLAFGITDEQLRPSLERLVRATKDVEAAQKLQTLALDISAGSGKSLEAVSNALGKAYEGNTGALSKLGVGLGAAELKTMDMNAITKTLSQTFAGQASEKADTFSGKMARLKVALDEAKESVGAALLPQITRLVDYIAANVVPQINAFVAGLTGNKGAKDALDSTGLASYELGKSFNDAATSVGKLFGTFNSSANTGESSGLAKVVGWMTSIVNAIGAVVNAIAVMVRSLQTVGAWIAVATNPANWFKGLSGMSEMVNAELSRIGYNVAKATGSTSQFNRSSSGMNVDFGAPVGSGSGGGGGGMTAGGISGGGAIGDAVAKGVSSALPKNIQYQPLPNMSPSQSLFSDLTGTSGNFPGAKVSPFLAQSPNISIVVNGAIDKEGTARQIVEILNDSYYRGTSGAGALVF